MVNSSISKTKRRMPRPYYKGDKVRDIYTGKVFTVKTCFLQNYAGGADYTVLFEPTETQPTPWNKSTNLEIA